MSITIKVNGAEYPATIYGLYRDSAWGNREVKTITLTMTLQEALALLPTGVKWSIVTRTMQPVIDPETGEQTGETETVEETDNSEYSLSGPATDNRDGTVSVKMGKPTDAERGNAAMTALLGAPVSVARAAELRPVIEEAAASLSDSEAAEAVELFPAWVVGIAVAEGERYSYGGRLYKCVAAHTTQEDWTPDKTPALWVVVDVTHAGTVDDPIPAARGMEYEYGKYYLDGEDGKTYLCARTGEPVGETVTLQYLPHELAGTYFEEVEA